MALAISTANSPGPCIAVAREIAPMWKDWLDKIPIPGLETLVVALLVALMSFLGARYLTRITERLTRPFVFSHELLSRIAAPLHLLIPLLALQAVWSSAP